MIVHHLTCYGQNSRLFYACHRPRAVFSRDGEHPGIFFQGFPPRSGDDRPVEGSALLTELNNATLAPRARYKGCPSVKYPAAYRAPAEVSLRLISHSLRKTMSRKKEKKKKNESQPFLKIVRARSNLIRERTHFAI